MELNRFDVEHLRRLLGRIDITHIPEECFSFAVDLYERLGRILVGGGKVEP